MKENGILLSAILDIGEALLLCGAEVNRVEDTIKRIAFAYGFVKTDVFTITSSIVVTVKDAENEIITQTRRIKGYQTDMHKIELLNALSRKICQNPLSVEELLEEIKQIQQAKTYSPAMIYFDYGMISAAFSLFFKGSLLDAVTSFICGLFLKAALDLGNKYQIQTLVLNAVLSFLVGCLAMIFIQLNIGHSFDKIVIGNIMLLIPGVSFTVSLRDMIGGDTISGLLGLAEAILKALAIAVGFALVLYLWGGIA